MTPNDRPASDRFNDPAHAKNSGMYELEYPAPLRAGEQNEPVPMLIALQGYADAGQAISPASTHLLQALEHSPVASFKVDELIDYRARRPGVTIDHSKVVDREDIELSLHLLKDTDDKPFLLLSGPEPDLKWAAFSDAVVELVKRCGVHRVITMYSAPMTVPHTRPLMLSAHATDRSLMKDYHSWDTRMIIPGSAALESELKLGKHGVETVGVTAHVPHYIAASDYPEATKALLSAAADLSERELPLGALDSDIARIRQQLEEQVEESHEIATVVAALERQYDAEVERQQHRRNNALLAPGEDIPTGEELGAEFEAFLADLGDNPDADEPRDDNGPRPDRDDPDGDHGPQSDS